MLASKTIAWGLVFISAAVAACAVQANPGPANPFRQQEVRASKSSPVVERPVDVVSEQCNDNPFRRAEAKLSTEVAQPATEPQKQEAPKQELQGKDEVFFPFACDPFTCEEITLANPLAVKSMGLKVALVQAEAEEVARPSSQPFQKPIGLLGVNIAVPKGTMPKNEAQEIVSTLPLAGNLPRPWPSLVYHWEAAATWHQPLYFEEVNAERYGYQCNWVAQPFVSTAHFFGTLPALPYLMTVNCPRECVYTLGNYRPGSCPPWRRHCIPCYDCGLW